MPLSDDQMKSIEAEEIYRQEVRDKLKPARSGGEKAWEFFNSPLTLWLLSTVVVGLVTLAYTNYQTSLRQAAERRELSQRLKKEIDHRQKERARLLIQVKEEAYKEYYGQNWIYKQSVIFLDGDKDSDLKDYHPSQEFKEKSWETLLIDFERASPTEGTDVSRLRTQYDVLGTLWEKTPDEKATGTSSDGDKAIEAVNKVSAIINPKPG